MMSRLIDADALRAWFSDHSVYDEFPVGYIMGLLDDQPTVEAVPVIRCKDCKFLRFTGTVWKCQNRLVMMLCEPNDYCSRAERKEE